ncbi:oxidoreductase domain protein : Oxidoreductase domain protein OS=Pirellula staleyi (strain ATCC 27377 / DSM 6068 / ICPB 4128) GN=Psta_3470 PE=4 SV=1: GFO_IDH_MocA [Gemmataceae bacterium]|nr:oxidoreductase domain protein : Oxidoreductase domain protein OS=Pirellula staleyi (strain ATCC 27377 / DSM 6068 / ICPB 4128) GN=Psta_3470 PE=4 SV=1: GFO_IDH_MocA [Gemmataceae bacterium]VTT98573.1 oxidoreductase domain protein : Oxidoreductase domain protein OS=Pirellula staleyi (strain ATCC 27377 / DSM 6068 / ICPB 4128) GN=Psta_3470 PE=4 SV=1: GFO_IDH_MocA [Gemmataceae bacterium]
MSLTRRTFLTATAAAPLVCSRAAGVAANDKIAVGFIGVGTMGRGHLGRFLGRNEVEVVAVCDVVKERLDSAKATVEKQYADRIKSGDYKGVKAFADFRELLALKGLDAVVIATPDHWHAITSVLAARAGKHVYCEKPLTQNVAEGRWIVDEVAKGKIVFQTGSQQRSEFGGHFRKAVEYVWNGRIGKLKTIRIGVGGPAKPCDLPAQQAPDGTDFDFWLGPAPERAYNEVLCPKGVHTHFPAWRNYQEYAGGAMADMGAHHFDIAQWAMGMDKSGPTEVIPPENPKSGKGLQFVYASGVVMIHNEFEKDKDGKEIKADCVFEGTEGTILVSRGGISSISPDVLKTPIAEGDKRVYPSNSHHGNWLECIRSGKETICTAETGHRSATICHLGNIGYRLGRKLAWDPAKETFANDDAANKELSREPRAKWKV